MSLEALLIDLDGVLRRWPADDDAIEAACDLPTGSLRRTAFAPALLQPAISGRIDDESWREQVACALQREFPVSRAAEAVRRWSMDCGATDAATLDIVDDLKQRHPSLRVVLVTNATSRLPHDLAALGLAGRFDAVVNSSELGIAKPAAGIFMHALGRAGSSAARSLFVDDSPGNVAAAQALGLHGHVFTGAAALRSVLQTFQAL